MRVRRSRQRHSSKPANSSASVKVHRNAAGVGDGQTAKAKPAASTAELQQPNKNALTSTPSEELDLLETAKTTLRAICNDPNAGASSRASAARTLLELVGAIKNPQQYQGLRATDEMSASEIDEAIMRLSKKIGSDAIPGGV